MELQSTRERALENRLTLLENRVVLLERFVETRFSDYGQDQTEPEANVRKGAIGRRKGTEKLTVVPEENPKTSYHITVVTKTRSGRSTKVPAKLSDAAILSPVTTSRSPGPSTKNKNDSHESVAENIKSGASSDNECISNEADDEYFSFSNDNAETEDEHKPDSNEPTQRGRDCSGRNTVLGKRLLKASAKVPVTARPVLTPRGRYKRRKLDSKASTIPPSDISIQNILKEECSVCHKFFRKEMLPTHMKCHTIERHLKCRYCEKTFFNTSMVRKHEKLHNRDKYARYCRLCNKQFVESGKLLVHERSCIRRALEKKQPVELSILEDIRKRSSGVDLKWPDTSASTQGSIPIDDQEKKCPYCTKILPLDEYPFHLKSHASWKCVLCQETYFNKAGLRKHMKNYHGQGPRNQEIEQSADATCTET